MSIKRTAQYAALLAPYALPRCGREEHASRSNLFNNYGLQYLIKELKAKYQLNRFCMYPLRERDVAARRSTHKI
jgi:hypothetical protein